MDIEGSCSLQSGCPTWIRTMNNASKGRCVTITPSDNPPVKVALGRALRQWIYDIRFTIYAPQPRWARSRPISPAEMNAS